MTRSEILRKYEESVQNAYKSYSILPHACKLIEVPKSYQEGEFKMFAQKLKIEKELLYNPANSFLLDSLGIDMAHAEIKQIIEEILKTATPVVFKSEATHNSLVKQITEHFAEGFNPKFLFVPIDYYMDVWKWTIADSPSKSGRFGYEWNIGNEIKLKIKYSNKRTPFDHFIISDKSFNEWKYRSDPKTGERFTVKFDTASDEINAYLNLKTVFQFTITDPEANRVLKFKSKKKK